MSSGAGMLVRIGPLGAALAPCKLLMILILSVVKIGTTLLSRLPGPPYGVQIHCLGGLRLEEFPISNRSFWISTILKRAAGFWPLSS
jgi:hypothetical protein